MPILIFPALFSLFRPRSTGKQGYDAAPLCMSVGHEALSVATATVSPRYFRCERSFGNVVRRKKQKREIYFILIFFLNGRDLSKNWPGVVAV